MYKKLLAAVLALLLLAGCAAQPSAPQESSADAATTTGGINATTGANTTTGGTGATTTVTTLPPSPPTAPASEDCLLLSKAGEPTTYQFIYDFGASSAVKDAAEALRVSIVEQLPESYPFFIWYNGTMEEPLEVLIGSTDRPESAALQATLTEGHKFAFKAYENGRVAICATSDDMLVLALECFAQQYINPLKGVMEVPKDLDYVYEKAVLWRLNAPEYTGGRRAAEVYNGGGGADMGGDVESKLQIICDTNRAQFDAYLATLKKEGYTEISRNEQLDNVYVQYSNAKKSKLVYVSFLGSLNEARVVVDTASLPETEFEYVCADGDVTVYQYAMMYNRNGNGGGEQSDPYPGNGMFYIIRLADNRLILIDGGEPRQATVGATQALYRFMQEITGKGENERVDIACWYLSHYHGDHFSFIQQFINHYPTDKINIERVMYNIPDGSIAWLGEQLVAHYPNVKFLKPHTGQKITLGNIDIDVLFTHEDYVDPVSGKSIISQGNNTSTVLRLHLNGKTMVVSGDWGGGHDVAPPEYAEGLVRMLKMHTKDGVGNYLKSDILQISHHALNPYMGIYNDEIAPDYTFVPAADVKLDQQSHHYVVRPNINQVINAGCDPDRVYFSSRYIYALHIAKNGNITVAAENIRGADKKDDPSTPIVEEDYMNITLKAYDAYRIPTAQEFANWENIHK